MAPVPDASADNLNVCAGNGYGYGYGGAPHSSENDKGKKIDNE